MKTEYRRLAEQMTLPKLDSLRDRALKGDKRAVEILHALAASALRRSSTTTK